MKVRGGRLLLDDLDWEILHILKEDSRQTYTEIGRRLGVAHSTVYDRIKKLEGEKIIEKYTVVVDEEKAGRRHITAVMTIFTEPKETENVAKQLAEYNEVLEVSTSLSEELVIIVKVVADNRESLHSFIAHSVAPLLGVLRIRTSIITRKFKEEGLQVKK